MHDCQVYIENIEIVNRPRREIIMYDVVSHTQKNIHLKFAKGINSPLQILKEYFLSAVGS